MHLGPGGFEIALHGGWGEAVHMTVGECQIGMNRGGTISHGE